MIDLKKIFVREGRGRTDPDSDYHPSDKSGDSLEAEYQALIANQFRRWGIASECVSIEVRRIGRAPDNLDVLVGMVRIGQWERDSVLRLLVGLPLLEAKVRKTVRATWLADFSHFAGLWLHASESINAGGHAAELRELMLRLAPPASGAQAAEAQDSGPATISSLLPTTSPPAGRGSRPGEPDDAAETLPMAQ